MKVNFFKYLILILIFVVSLIIYFSVIGIETDKFNRQIKDKIYKVNNNLDLDLKKIKLTLDPINFKIKAKTVGATIYYSKKPLELEYIKTSVSLASIIKNKFVSSNIEIITRSILMRDIIKFVRVKSNRPELFVLEKIIKKGHAILNLSLNFDENGNIKNDYSLKGLVKDGKIKLLKNNDFKNINFKFYIKKDNFVFQEIQFTKDKINFSSNLLEITRKKNSFLFEGEIENKNSILSNNFLKLIKVNLSNFDFKNTNFDSKNNFSFEINNKFKFKNIVLQSDINLQQIKYKTEDSFFNYFTKVNKIILFKNHKLNLNYKKDKLSIKGLGKIQVEEKFENIEYHIIKDKDYLNLTSDLIIENISLKKIDFLERYFPLMNDKINMNNHKLNINYQNKKFSLKGSGKIKIDNDFEQINYFISKKKEKFNFDVDINLDKTHFIINELNYKKSDKNNTKLKIIGNFEEKKYLNLSNFNVVENDNKIKITNLLLSKENLIVKIDKLDLDYVDIENKQNQFSIQRKEKDNYELNGLTFNAKSLISNLLKDSDERNNKIFENNVSLKLNLNEAYIDEIYFIKNLKGRLFIKNNQVREANISGVFKDKENIKFTINTDNEGKKITTLNSTWAKPLVNRYKFIKGFEEGYLDFYSSKKNGVSNSLLIIDNFKIKEIPVLAKLLSLASLQGIADLLTGEGIRFTDFEMKFSNKKKLMTIEELYAIGPSMSILTEGYIQSGELISLRGTLVPATTINRTIASLPLIGDLLIGKKVGEGVFGVSFKVKGPPKELKTTVNPIKTLTPRFITRTLEKIKKN